MGGLHFLEQCNDSPCAGNELGTITVAQVKPSGPEQSSNNEIGGHTTRAFQIDISLPGSLPVFGSNANDVRQVLEGHLIVKAGNLVKTRPLKLIPYSPSHYASYPVWIGIAISALAVLVSVFRLQDRLDKPLGLPAWDGTGSWATNLTVIQSVLTSLVSSTLFSVTHHLLKNEYTSLSLLFSVLVLIAPVVYSLIRKPSEKASTTLGQPQYEGYVWLYLVASGLTLWGVFGQLATVIIMIDEFRLSRYTTSSVVVAFQILLILVGVLTFAYALVTMYTTAATDRTEPKKSATEAGAVADSGTAAAPLVSWPLL